MLDCDFMTKKGGNKWLVFRGGPNTYHNRKERGEVKILVTGALGHLCRAVVNAAKGRHETVSFDIQKPEGEKPANFIQGDVTNLDEVLHATEGCDAIIHPAGLTGAHLRTHSHADFIRVNVTGTDNIFQAALEQGIGKVCCCSTMEVTLGRDWMAWGASIQDEETPPRPDSIYPLTKYMGEQTAHFFHNMHGIKVAIFRYMSFDSRPPETIGLSLIARWVWVVDVAEANLLAAESDRVEDDLFHIGPLNRLTQQDVVQGLTDPEVVLEKHYPGSVELLKKASIPIRPVLWPVTRIDKARQILEWTPQFTFDDYLEHLRQTLGVASA